MNLRHKFARSIHKWADLIDPRTNPTTDNAITVKIGADITEFEEAMRRAEEIVADLETLSARAAILKISKQ